MAMNRTQFRKLLEPGLNAVFGLAYKDYQPEWNKLFPTFKSMKATEEDVLLVGLGLAPVKSEGAGIEFDSGRQAWASLYIHEVIALGFILTQEMIEDGLYGNMGEKYAKELKRSLMHTKEMRASNIFNNAFSTNQLGGDGKSLCSTSHPLAGGGTWANTPVVPVDLSETAIEDASIAIGNFVNDRGLFCAFDIDTLAIPDELKFEAQRILQSDQRSGTNDNDTNALKDLKTVKNVALNHRFTDTDAWFLITNADDGLKHFDRAALQTATEGEFNSGNIKYKARERYSFGWTDPRAVYGSPGA